MASLIAMTVLRNEIKHIMLYKYYGFLESGAPLYKHLSVESRALIYLCVEILIKPVAIIIY